MCATYPDTYGHSRIERMFDQADVYDVGYDADRAAKKPVRLGIIGVGGVAQSKHIPAIQRLRTQWEPVEIVGYATRNAQQTLKMRSIYAGNWYSDYLEMLDAQKPDGVIISSADSAHYEQTMACIERGIGVLVEKPIARSLVKAKEMVLAAEKAGVLLMTVANKRYSPPYVRAKREITSGACGNPALFSGKFNLGYDYVDILEGGTVHLFDICRYLMGDVQSLSAEAVLKYDFNKTDYPFDNGVCSLRFESGAVGSILTSSSALSLKPWERVEVYAKNNWLAVEDQYALTVYDSEQGPAKTYAPVVPNTLLFDEEFAGFMPMMQDFIESLRTGERPLATGMDGYKAYELVCAFHISARERRTVNLPLDPAEADERVKTVFEEARANGTK